MNYIEKLRADIKKDFDEQTFEKGDFETFTSPSSSIHRREKEKQRFTLSISA